MDRYPGFTEPEEAVRFLVKMYPDVPRRNIEKVVDRAKAKPGKMQFYQSFLVLGPSFTVRYRDGIYEVQL